MFQDIRWRIAIPYVILILVVMGGLTIYLSRTTRDAQLEALRNSLLVQARTLSASLQPSFDNVGAEGLDQQANLWSELLRARVTIIGTDGTVLGESDEDRELMNNHLNRPEVQQALVRGEGSSIRFSQTLDTDMMYAAVPLEKAGEIIAIVRIALPLEQIERNIGQLQRAILTAALIASAAAVVVAVVIAGRTSRSVHRLTQVANRMAAGDLDARLRLAPRDDLGDLTRAFNYMGDQLRDRVHDLADERGRLAAVLDNMADGVLITDGMGRVGMINPAAARLLRVDSEEAIGRSFAEVTRHHGLIESWQQGFDQRQEQMTAVEIDRKGTFVQMIVSPLDMADGQGYLVILQDLTRIRRLETVRRDFISNISHELRTPLASLKALVETLRDGAMDDPPAAKRFLDHAEYEVDALTQMVEELLELTRIESGMVPLRLSPTPVSDVVLPPVDRFRRQAERHDLSLIVDLPDDLPPVMSDASRAQQVVGNLVHNSIKFTPEGGTVTIRAKLGGDEPVVVISVQDTGTGIPASELPRIFERFYKADQSRSSGGIGLGLAIAKHLTQAHGGRIWAKSKGGKGSTFYFTLPIAGESSEEEGAKTTDTRTEDVALAENESTNSF
jgi:two-component system phosphate regulon sensor histidine kinase PhoR